MAVCSSEGCRGFLSEEVTVQGPADPSQGPSQASSLAVNDPPPVVTPGKQPSPGRGQGQVLIVAAGEQDVLPAWGLL